MDEEKDLGVTIDSELSFEAHMDDKINKANGILGLIRRTFTYLDKDILLTLYKALVRPHLEYANTLWKPRAKKYIKSIENVQIRATGLIPELKHLPYEERLRVLKLPTLVYRRERGDMIEVWKHFNSYDHSVIPKHFTHVPRERSSRQHDMQLKYYRPGSKLQEHSFYFRIVQKWNTLPSAVVHCNTIDNFKTQLDKEWKDNTNLYDFMDEQ